MIPLSFVYCMPSFETFMKLHQIVFGNNELNNVKFFYRISSQNSKFQFVSTYFHLFSERCQNIGS